MPEITGILLAAGQGERFSGNKLLAEINNRALVLHAADSLSPCTGLLAVVRRDDIALHELLHNASIELVINEQPEQGMGSSISCGVAASRGSHGWCLLPADMPLVQASTTQRVITALQQGAALAAPYYDEKRGHPVGFSHRFISELLLLNKQTGARNILQRNLHRLEVINCDDPAILIDIDTADDLQRVIDDSGC